jgi:UDP-N-acetylglucosamine--N-acetylmuramyl-(pentapeptide) pyrophosphoryl-undecaprenol N-acetylglucosamine transferase
MRILFAGGGTGGHLFPALAIAQEVKKIDTDCQIKFVGTRYGIEARMKDTIGYPLAMIAIRGLPRRLSWGLLLFPVRLIVSVVQAMRLCSRFRPDIVVGTGGYVSGPIIIAAAIKKIPRVLQEQNSYPGIVTRKLASKADMVFIAYKKAGEFLPSDTKRMITGNPVRKSIMGGNRVEALKRFELHDNRKTILILGGSQGAHRINEAILRSLEYLDDDVQLLWQCGKRDHKEVAARLNKKDFVISLFPFSDNMESVYAAADLAIARAGALTIAELTACGIPAILIPYPYATADHQTHNASEIVKSGAADMISDTDLDQTMLLQKAMEIIRSGRLKIMRDAAEKLGRPEAASEIAREVLQLAGFKGEQLDAKDTECKE